VEVVGARSLPISLFDAHERLPEDKDWSGRLKARVGSAVLYNRSAELSSEKLFAFSTGKGNLSIDIEIHDIGLDLMGRGSN
jgi:hypothetical protein